MDMAAGGQMMGVREAAIVLNLNPSTVSRQIGKFVASGLLQVEERDGKKLFDVESYRRAAGLASNPLKARNVAPDAAFAAPVAAPGAQSFQTPNLNSAATAHKAIQAQLLKIELDRATGAVVERAAVRHAMETAARELRDAILALPARCKGALASMTDTAEIQRYLDAEMRALLGQLQNSFSKLSHPQDETEGDVA